MTKKTERDEGDDQFARFSRELVRVLEDFPELEKNFRVFVAPRTKTSLQRLALAEADQDPCKGRCEEGQNCEFEPISGRWVCRP